MNSEEKLLLVTVVGLAVVMLVKSFEYTPNARLFPQTAAILTITFGVLIVVNKRLDFLSENGTDIIGEVNERSELDEIHADRDDSEDSVPKTGIPAPGEFRIDQPITEYTIPFLGYSVTHRATLVVLLILYLPLMWLFGAFVSSLVFLFLYAKVVGLRVKIVIGLTVFVVSTLLIFGLWLETPIFRTGHGLFEEVSL